jgi:hypothetical protein
MQYAPFEGVLDIALTQINVDGYASWCDAQVLCMVSKSLGRLVTRSREAATLAYDERIRAVV